MKIDNSNLVIGVLHMMRGQHMNHGMYGYGFGYNFWLIALIVLLIIMINIGIMLLVKNSKNKNEAPTSSTPIHILKERLAKGEIDEDEYDRLKEKLKD